MMVCLREAMAKEMGDRVVRGELLYLALGQSAVERIGGRHGADEDEHDQAHALLAIIRPMEEADQGAVIKMPGIHHGGGWSLCGS